MTGARRMVAGLVLAVAVAGCATSADEDGSTADPAATGAAPSGSAPEAADLSGSEDVADADAEAGEAREAEVDRVVVACRPTVDRIASFASALREGEPGPARVEAVTEATQRCVDATTRAHEVLNRGDSQRASVGTDVVEVRRLVRQVQDHVAELDGRSTEDAADGDGDTTEAGPDGTSRDLRRLADDLDRQLRQLA